MPGDRINKKLLIIEDDLDILQVLELIFMDQGYNVFLSQTGEETDCLDSINPDLILLDIRLTGAGKEGDAICKEIKSRESTRHIPVILLSAETDISVVSAACGADDFISKPFDIIDLTEKVKSFVEVSS